MMATLGFDAYAGLILYCTLYIKKSLWDKKSKGLSENQYQTFTAAMRNTDSSTIQQTVEKISTSNPVKIPSHFFSLKRLGQRYSVRVRVRVIAFTSTPRQP